MIDDALHLGGAERLDVATALLLPDDGPAVKALLPAAALGARAGVAERKEAESDGAA